METKTPIRAASLLLIAISLFFAQACGVKGSPEPPLRPRPPSVTQVEILPRETYNLIRWMAPAASTSRKQTAVTYFVIRRSTKAPGESAWSEAVNVSEVPVRGAGEQMEWEDRDVGAGVLYRYQVFAGDKKERLGDPSSPVQAQWAQPPGVPKKVRITVGDRSLNIDWDSPGGDVKVEGYFVYRAGPTGFVRLTEDALQQTWFLDGALTNGQTFRYFIRAAGIAGTNLVEGPASPVVEATPADLIAPQVPVGVGAFPAEGGGALVKWWPNDEPDLAGYNVYRESPKPEKPEKIASAHEAEYLDAAAVTGRTYIYCVTAIDKAGNESAKSEPARVYVKR